jgi:glyoxylase-like metal-dependent hydrolase (beta-lactamase superfamily II)
MFQVKAFVFSPIQENTYLLYNEHGSAILIDPGCYYQDERETLADFISENRLKPVFLLNTHCHLDHVFGNRWVHESYGLSLHLHPKERPVLEMAPASGLMWNLPFDQYTGPLLDLEPGTSIDLGEDQLEILFAPGHSPGHICFYCRRQGFLIGGDVLFRESIGRTDLPGGNHAQLISSIQTQLMPLPEETIVYSGHGIQTTIGHERRYNPFLQD